MILNVDPKVDFAFKYLFGRESNKAILINVLNSVQAAPPGHEIVDIELLNPFNLQEAVDDKLSILDIKARDQSGRQFNIEMQMLASPYYEKRVVYYAARLHKDQLQEGQDYGQLCPTISISFLNHVLFPKASGYHSCFHLLEDTHHFRMTDDIEFHILELPKFNKGPEELKTDGFGCLALFSAICRKDGYNGTADGALSADDCACRGGVNDVDATGH